LEHKYQEGCFFAASKSEVAVQPADHFQCCHSFLCPPSLNMFEIRLIRWMPSDQHEATVELPRLCDVHPSRWWPNPTPTTLPPLCPLIREKTLASHAQNPSLTASRFSSQSVEVTLRMGTYYNYRDPASTLPPVSDPSPLFADQIITRFRHRPALCVFNLDFDSMPGSRDCDHPSCPFIVSDTSYPLCSLALGTLTL
jgi:hypothetical protein